MVNAESSCSVTIFIMANNETDTLRETIVRIHSLKHFDCIKKIIVVAKSQNSNCVTEAQKIISQATDDIFDIYIQKAPNFERCLCELPPMVKTSHFVIMSADMETDPATLDDFIEKATSHPERIICASKWHKDARLEGYGNLHKLATSILNLILSIILKRKATDIVGLYQIYPLSIYKKLNFNHDRSFGYQYTIKALRNNVEYEEIPTTYIHRTEGKTNFRLPSLLYVGVWFIIFAIKTRLSPEEEAFKIKGNKE